MEREHRYPTKDNTGIVSRWSVTVEHPTLGALYTIQVEERDDEYTVFCIDAMGEMGTVDWNPIPKDGEIYG